MKSVPRHLRKQIAGPLDQRSLMLLPILLDGPGKNDRSDFAASVLRDIGFKTRQQLLGILGIPRCLGPAIHTHEFGLFGADGLIQF